MKWGRTKEPIVLSIFQMRVALELAAEKAAQLEIKHQLEPYFPGADVVVDGSAIHIHSLSWEPFTVADREVIWED